MTATAETLATPAEMARRYHVTVSTFLSWYHAGRIPAAVAIGKIYRFDPAAVEQALTEKAASSPK